jgi:Uncharacterized protein conserved in bacteria (DUF2188)
MQHYHLVKHADFWRLEEEGGNKAILTADTQAEALEQTRDYMNTRDGAVWIHGADGRIQESRTFSTENAGRNLAFGLSWPSLLTIGITFAAGCALAWHYRRDIRDIDLDRLRRLVSRR